MSLFWKAAAAVLLAVVLGLSLGKQKDIGVLLTMAVCCMVAMIAISYLEPVLDFLRELETLGDLQGDMLGILLKAVGIGLVSEIAGLVCTDAGNGSLGKTLQMLGSAVILYLSLPIFTAMLELIREMLRAVALIFALAIPASAVEFTAPQVPEGGAELMPEDTGSFAAGLMELLRDAVLGLRPDLKEASKVSLGVIAAVMMVSLLQSFSGSVKTVANLVGATAIAAGLLLSANSLIRLGSQTVTEISEYGKLLLPVMTAAMAAQGGAASSTALYAGTAVFDSVLSSLISRMLGPMVYLFLALSAANGAIGENILGKLRDLVKNVVSWSLKTILTVFTTYMTVTGVVSGTTDAAALKATKVTISSVVPVVGGILSDASEAVLVSAGLMKNAAGIYGILAVLAVFLSPFLKIGVHYLILKLTAAVCGIFGEKGLTELIGDFSTAMGLLLAMTGSECLLLLISTVCFLKGVG